MKKRIKYIFYIISILFLLLTFFYYYQGIIQTNDFMEKYYKEISLLNFIVFYIPIIIIFYLEKKESKKINNIITFLLLLILLVFINFKTIDIIKMNKDIVYLENENYEFITFNINEITDITTNKEEGSSYTYLENFTYNKITYNVELLFLTKNTYHEKRKENKTIKIHYLPYSKYVIKLDLY